MSEYADNSIILLDESTSNCRGERSQAELSKDERSEMIQQLTKCPTCNYNNGNCATKRHIELSLLFGSKEYNDTLE